MKRRRVWTDVGFEPFSNAIVVLDPVMVTLGEKLAAFRTTFDR